MTISQLTPGTQVQHGAGRNSIEVLTQSTATAAQTLSVNTYVSVLGAGTATGSNGINVYVLPAGPVGTEKFITLSATGEATLRLTMATGQHYWGRDLGGLASASQTANAWIGAATGAFVLTAKGQWLRTLFTDDAWVVLGGVATIATAT